MGELLLAKRANSTSYDFPVLSRNCSQSRPDYTEQFRKRLVVSVFKFKLSYATSLGSASSQYDC